MKPNLVPSQFKFPKCFGFYLTLLSELRTGKRPSYEIIHSAGGRNCGKTYCFTLFVTLLFYYRVPAIIYAFRKQQGQVKESIWQEFLNRFKNTNINHQLNKTGFIIDNGVAKIVCFGLYNPRGEQVVRKGLAGGSNYRYSIKWFEEASEFLEKDVAAIDQAVRGSRYLIKVMTTNPWHAANPYIKYLNTKFPFNKAQLLENGYQWHYEKASRELFHYANYRVNPTITEQEVKVLEDMRWEDANEWAIISIGLPGVPSGGVYANLLKNVSRLTQPGDTYSCGIDFGFKHDPMAIILVSTQRRIWKSVDVLAELYFNNQSRYSWQTLATKIVNWLVAQSLMKPRIKTGLIIFCDKSNLTFIEMLNIEAKKQNATYLNFVASFQISVPFRISFKQGLMGANKLNLSLQASNLYQELATATWDLKSTKPQLARDVLDHASDALDYALTPWYNYLMSTINPSWFRKTPLPNFKEPRNV